MGWEEWGVSGRFFFFFFCSKSFSTRIVENGELVSPSASMEVKGQPPGDSSLDLGPLRRWVASQHIPYGLFSKLRRLVFERLSPVAEPKGG